MAPGVGWRNLSIIDPSTEQPLAEVSSATADDVIDAVEIADAAGKGVGSASTARAC